MRKTYSAQTRTLRQDRDARGAVVTLAMAYGAFALSFGFAAAVVFGLGS